MSIRNIEVKSPKAEDSPKESPYYIKDLRKEVLLTLGLDYSNINELNKLDNKKYSKYIEKFQKDIEKEINFLYKLYNIGENNEELNNEFQKHIENINNYSKFILKTVSVNC